MAQDAAALTYQRARASIFRIVPTEQSAELVEQRAVMVALQGVLHLLSILGIGSVAASGPEQCRKRRVDRCLRF